MLCYLRVLIVLGTSFLLRDVVNWVILGLASPIQLLSTSACLSPWAFLFSILHILAHVLWLRTKFHL
ncbi:hypothetical protein OIU84_015123 [Salix udensis]|uniref:Uncharacterized protein n=1 Tax=Salix udensis TaxID=889485 RepID=A0AAD6NRR8_9ROSI|nr:hypothetical protein OIU84_015123 [Salix udensis]